MSAVGSGRKDSSTRLLGDTLGARVLLSAFAVVSVAMVTRVAGASVYGVFATATAFSTLLSFFTDLGSSQVVVRESLHGSDPGPDARAYVQTRMILVAATAVFGAGAVLIAF